MFARALRGVVLCAAVLSPLTACHRAAPAAPPPDARRPKIKSQEELAAERDERIRSGEVVPTSAPARLDAEGVPTTRLNIPPPIHPGPGAIEADILLVNDTVLTLPEALYPLSQRIAEARQNQTREGSVEAIQRLLQAHVQQQVGAILIYKEATAALADPQREVIKNAVDREVQGRISRDFGGSSARFEHHLTRHGLTLERYRGLLERDMVARQYTREKLLPQVSVRRDELLGYYRHNAGQYASAETRALWMIEAPFETFLDDGSTWARSSANAKAQAKLKARQHILAAHAALAERPFEDVAREYSRGVQAAQGGTWGEIGRPLQAPYDQVSALVFQLAEGQYGEPLETERGWYIVKCGHITPAQQRTFADVQDEIRQQLTERKFDKLSAEYMIRLAGDATVSSLDAFIKAGVRRALEQEPEDDVR